MKIKPTPPMPVTPSLSLDCRNQVPSGRRRAWAQAVVKANNFKGLDAAAWNAWAVGKMVTSDLKVGSLLTGYPVGHMPRAAISKLAETIGRDFQPYMSCIERKLPSQQKNAFHTERKTYLDSFDQAANDVWGENRPTAIYSLRPDLVLREVINFLQELNSVAEWLKTMGPTSIDMSRHGPELQSIIDAAGDELMPAFAAMVALRMEKS